VIILISKKLKCGIFVSDSENNLYMVVEIKKKNKSKLITCLPIIDKKIRKKTDRYVYEIFSDKLLVISRPEKFFDYQLHYEKPRLANNITDDIIRKYRSFNPELYDISLKDVSSSDGLRNGNPWHGIAMLNSHPKIYRG